MERMEPWSTPQSKIQGQPFSTTNIDWNQFWRMKEIHCNTVSPTPNPMRCSRRMPWSMVLKTTERTTWCISPSHASHCSSSTTDCFRTMLCSEFRLKEVQIISFFQAPLELQDDHFLCNPLLKMSNSVGCSNGLLRRGWTPRTPLPQDYQSQNHLR